MSNLLHYEDADAEVRAVFDDIKRTRNVADVNNFWKALAAHPPTLRRTWDSLKAVMGPGALDPVVKEMLYLAVSVTNGCGYCIASHGAAARKAGMTEEMWGNSWPWSAWRTRRTSSRSGCRCRSTRGSRRSPPLRRP